jgi:hypothetical protein
VRSDLDPLAVCEYNCLVILAGFIGVVLKFFEVLRGGLEARLVVHLTLVVG